MIFNKLCKIYRKIFLRKEKSNMKIQRVLALAMAASLLISFTAFAGAPEMPDNAGQAPAGQEAGEQAPGESPDGQAPDGQSEGQQGQGESAGGAGGGMGMPPGGSASAPTEYDAVITVSEDTTYDGEVLKSENSNENALHVTGGAVVNVKNCSVNKTGDASGGDSSSFYGVGAALLVSEGELYVSDTEITSEAAGGTGVFAYDTGVAYVSNVTIHNSGSNSCGGIHAAGGGTLYAWNCNVETTGGSSAAIRSDRGGGLMVIDGGSYVTQNGTGAVYCTADITVHDAYLYAGQSEAMAIEGKNTIRLFDCSLEGNMQPTGTNDNKVWNCIVYQSMSGDSEVGTSEFDMIGGELICHAGPVVFNTNTSSYITFSDCNITYGDDTTYFLQVTGNSSSRTWGTAGDNGANCIFSAYDQVMSHDVMYDTISTLEFYLLDGSAWEGAMICDNEYNGGYEGDGIANVYVDETSTWTVTGDSTINGTLYLAGTLEGAQVVGTDGTVYVEGDGYTVTVGGFETTVDSSAAGTIPVWEDYAVENPFAE